MVQSGGFAPLSTHSPFELKFCNLAIQGGDLASEFQYVAIPEVKGGSGQNERIGRQITMKRYAVRWALRLPAVSAALAGAANFMSAINMRVILYVDRQNNSLLEPPNLEGGLLDNGAGTSNELGYAYRTLSKTRRFVVLKDEIFNLQRGDPISDNGTGAHWPECRLDCAWYVKKDISFSYSDTNGLQPSLTENCLFLAFIPITSVDIENVPGARPLVEEISIRMRYTDA